MTCKKFLPASLLLLLLIAGGLKVGAQTTPDPGLMGTHTVLKGEYNLGDLFYDTIPGYLNHKMECRGAVYYPSDLSSGPFPVLFWLHGRHSTCYDPSSLSDYSQWPCNPGDSPIVSYEGYEYVAKTMASHGYIVISISANAINAYDGVSGYSIDDGMTARGRLMQYHMDLWNDWNTTVTTGPFGSTFIGRLNMQNIGTMGHSRGGEGAIYNALYNESLGSPYGIKAIFTLAPVDFYRKVVNGIPIMDLAPYCDGDVSDLQGVHFYDDARYPGTADQTPKHTILMMGANHDFFNTVWTPYSYPAGGADDWADYGHNPFDPQCGTTMPTRFDTTKQKAALNAYMPAFFRLYIGKESQFAPILEVNDRVPPVSSMLDSSNVFVSYFPGFNDKMDINQTTSTFNLTVNTLSGAVTTHDFMSTAICGGGSFPTCDAGPGGSQLPHDGMGQMRMRWSDTTAWYNNAIPVAKENWTGYQNLLFRASVDFAETSPGPELNFTVQIVDSAGDSSSQVVSSLTQALYYPPGTETWNLPKEVFNTINVPLSGFTGINIAKVRNVRFKLDESTAGSLLITDLAVTNPICGDLKAGFTHVTAGFGVTFTNTTQYSTADTISYLWNFGNPASGLSDTSTLAHPPAHLYTGSGAYTPCLYVKVRRTTGMICVDTFCSRVVLGSALQIQGQNEQRITIFPNPAKDYIQISGAEKTDVLKLVNLYGQEVYATTINQPIVNLPAGLANGLYYAIVISPKGNVYQKLVINR